MQPEPQSPRRRWPLRRVAFLLLPPAAALAAILVARGDVAHDDGVKDVAFRFRVTEAGTGRPLPGAFLRFFEQNQVARDLPAGTGGEAEMILACPVTVRNALFSRRAMVTIPDWTFIAQARDHKPAGPYYLRDFVGPRGEQDAATAPAVIEVRMEKQDPAPAGE